MGPDAGVAALEAVCASARAGDEPAERSLERVGKLVERTTRVVDELLLENRPGGGARARCCLLPPLEAPIKVH